MADLQKIVDDLSSLTVLEAAELAKLLEEKWGVSAAAAVAVAGPAAAAAAPVEEKTEFTVVLAAAGDPGIVHPRRGWPGQARHDEGVGGRKRMRAKGFLGTKSYTRMCGDSNVCPSNLHDCHPI